VLAGPDEIDGARSRFFDRRGIGADVCRIECDER
jgi:hypothetical protein